MSARGVPNASARRNVAFINSTCVIPGDVPRASTHAAHVPCFAHVRAQTVERPRGANRSAVRPGGTDLRSNAHGASLGYHDGFSQFCGQ